MKRSQKNGKQNPAKIGKCISLDRYAVKSVPIGSIKPSPENVDIYGEIEDSLDPALGDLIASIQKRGLEEPIIITKDSYILSGHRRYKACKSLNWSQVPVRVADLAREGCDDYHRALTEFNPQRIKGISTLLKERLLRETPEETYGAIQRVRNKKQWLREPEFMDVDGSKNFEPISEKKQEFLEAVQEVIASMKKFWPLSIRQIHYKLLNKPPLKMKPERSKFDVEHYRYKNDESSYNALIGLLTSARYSGDVDIYCIDDPTRPEVLPGGFESVHEFIEQELSDFLLGYGRNYMADQDVHIEVFGEKNTLMNILRPICDEFCIPLSLARGYCSIPTRRNMENRFTDSGKDRMVVMMVTDHDPEGLDLADDFVRSMRDLHQIEEIEAVRVGLTKDQIDQLSLPPNYAKETSTRFKAYVERTGSNKCWEVEALDPEYLQDALRDAIEGVLDMDLFTASQEAERNDIEEISRFRRSMATLMPDVGGAQPSAEEDPQ